MSIQTAFSTKPLPEAVVELRQQARDPRVVIYFASSNYEPAALARQMKETFPKSVLVGCSTAGEIVSGKMLSGSVVAMFLGADVVEDAAYAVVPLDKPSGLSDAFAVFEKHFGSPLAAMDVHRYAGIVLVDGLSGAEEKLMEELGDRTDLIFVGGSAGDDLKFKSTRVFADGRDFGGAALLLLMRLPKGFDILKTQSFHSTGKRLVATSVDMAARMVIELNGRPALEAYAEAVGMPASQAAAVFMKHPLGLMVGDEPFVRSPRGVEGSSILFYCQIREGMELELLDAEDIVGDTRRALEAKRKELGSIAGLIDFHCILRTLQLRGEQRCDSYGSIFTDVPAVGFSTYGEQFLGHINQTSTMLLFR